MQSAFRLSLLFILAVGCSGCIVGGRSSGQGAGAAAEGVYYGLGGIVDAAGKRKQDQKKSFEKDFDKKMKNSK